MADVEAEAEGEGWRRDSSASPPPHLPTGSSRRAGGGGRNGEAQRGLRSTPNWERGKPKREPNLMPELERLYYIYIFFKEGGEVEGWRRRRAPPPPPTHPPAQARGQVRGREEGSQQKN